MVKIAFEQGLYKYIKTKNYLDYGVFVSRDNIYNKLKFRDAVINFIENYAKKYCKKRTYETYE